MKKITHLIGILTMFLLSFIGNAQTISPLNSCNSGMFDLTLKVDEILNGDNLDLYIINFYETLTDAEFDTNAIVNPENYFSPSVPPFFIFFRKENNADQTYTLGNFQVNVLPNPEIGISVNLINPDGLFDLTSNEALITSGNNYTLSYYASYQNAMTNTNPISDSITNYSTSENTTIWVVVTNVAGCSLLTSFNLIVDTDSIVYIPDSAFKNKLLQANTNNNIASNQYFFTIKIDTNNDGEIQYSEALDVVHLYINNSSISDLTGIEAFANLAVLDGSTNNLTSVDLSNNKNINSIWLFNNPLTHLNIKSGTAMNPDMVDSGSWWEMWTNLPDYVYICADEEEIPDIAPFLNDWGTTGQVISSYCTYYPVGDYNTINGTMFYDQNNEGCDGNNISNYVKVVINDGAEEAITFTNPVGVYQFFTQTGAFTLTPQIENPDFFNITPVLQTVTFTDNNNNEETVNFCITANGVNPDVEVVLAPLVPARPGFDATYKIVYRNKGNQTVSGSINLEFDDAKLDFVLSNPVLDNQSVGLLTYHFTDLAPFETKTIEITLNVNSPMETPAVNIDDILPFSAEITISQTDVIPDDNIYEFNQVVVGAYDPNDITCIEGDVVSPDYIGEELHYLIRFENTGNFYAENVVVVMEIDPAKYDVSSLRVLNSSHDVRAQVRGNKAEFFFNQIYLDSGGHGNILLVMKSVNSLSEGDSVQSKADIYFDFNYPIITNDAVTLFQATMSIEDNIKNIDVRFYPNPTTDYFNITSEAMIQSVELYDVSGRLVRTSLVNDFESRQNVSNLTNGTYILKIKTEQGEVKGKIIKK